MDGAHSRHALQKADFALLPGYCLVGRVRVGARPEASDLTYPQRLHSTGTLVEDVRARRVG